MKQLIIFSVSDNLIGLKNKIFNELISDGENVSNNILYFNPSNINDLMKYNDITKDIILVVEKGVRVNDSIIKKIKTKNAKTLSIIEYDSTAGTDNLDKDGSVSKLKDNDITDDIFNSLFSMYSDGYSEEYIGGFMSDLSSTFDDFMNIIVDKHIKSNSNRLSDDLKKAISNRDKIGISRKSIARELNINYKTVQRACEKYGNANKNMDKSNGEESLEFVTSDFKVDDIKKTLICPKCNNRTNQIDLGWSVQNYYCKQCLEEYFIKPLDGIDSVFRIKWENIN